MKILPQDEKIDQNLKEKCPTLWVCPILSASTPAIDRCINHNATQPRPLDLESNAPAIMSWFLHSNVKHKSCIKSSNLPASGKMLKGELLQSRTL